MAPPGPKPFQLLEINIISAQDLEPVSKKMKTYSTAWMHQNRKLSSSVDSEGNNNPTWNDKFVFRVDDEFLRQDTSAIMIEIYAVHWFRDVLVGTVRVLVGNLIPPPTRPHGHHGAHHIGMRFVALQVRRPSGRPQGILNIGVALLDRSMRSMPLYKQLSMSAVGYRDLMDHPTQLQTNKDEQTNINNAPKSILRRSRSERSERLGFDNISPSSSIVAIPSGKKGVKESSILSITECEYPFKGMPKIKGKASSVISGAELREKPKQKGKKGTSVLSDSFVSKESSNFHKMGKGDDVEKDTKNEDKDENPTNKVVDEKSITKPKDKLPIGIVARHVSKYNKGYGYDQYGAPHKGSLPQSKYVIGAKKGHSILSDSEVGPSPSEVAAAMAERRYPLDDNQSSVLDGWSVDESVEGLKSKLERWRMELPPLYDRNGFSTSSYRSSVRGHERRRSESESGLFSCFGNIFGYECQCICGKPPARRSLNAKFHQSPSTLTPGRSFL